MDWRKPKYRRIGEKDGPISLHWLFDVVCYTGIAAVLLYGAFHAGRYYEGKVVTELQAEIEKIKAEKTMAYYGPGYYYFRDKGITYFVRDSKDLENKNKWVRLK